MRWAEVIDNPLLQDLPFKIELNRWGRIENKRLREIGLVTPFPKAPELCVDIESPANSWAEMHVKAGHYLEAGAEEVWVVTLDGKRTVIKPEA